MHTQFWSGNCKGSPTYKPESKMAVRKIWYIVSKKFFRLRHHQTVTFLATKLLCSGMWHRVDTDVSEERIASIFRVEKFASEEPAWAGGSLLSQESRFPTFRTFVREVHGSYLGRDTDGPDWVSILAENLMLKSEIRTMPLHCSSFSVHYSISTLPFQVWGSNKFVK
jgi:hypothetical protein